jgi:hypothetical protein
MFFISLAKGQIGPGNKISFTYDAAGNRVKRMVVDATIGNRIGADQREVKLDSLISIFPNPTADLLNIRLENFKISTPINISILDVSGRIILSKNYIYPETIIDMRSYKAGYYILMLKRENYTNTWKIIKNTGVK